MVLPPNEKRSHLFTVRVWEEETGAGRTEWRGKIQRVIGGESLYFRDWQVMTLFLLQTLGISPPAPDSTEGRPQSQEETL
jgi:hypothetical protein